MSLLSTADEIIVLEPSMGPPSAGMHLVPLEVSESPSHGHDHDHEDGGVEVQENPIEVMEDLRELPNDILGLNGPDPQPIEVHEEEVDKSMAVDEDLAKTKKNEKWDWASRGATGFIAWVKERCDDVPKHSGYDTAGLERAIAYLERLDNEVSRAMRMDLDGELDANQIEKVRSIIDNGVERLNDRLEKVKASKKKPRKKKAEFSEGMVKEAQKVTGVQGVFVTVPLLISRIARVCINGMVSAGHDIEDLYQRQVKFYKLNDREQAEVMQLLADMGYAVKQDRGFMPDQDVEPSSSDNMDWAANYKG